MQLALGNQTNTKSFKKCKQIYQCEISKVLMKWPKLRIYGFYIKKNYLVILKSWRIIHSTVKSCTISKVHVQGCSWQHHEILTQKFQSHSLAGIPWCCGQKEGRQQQLYNKLDRPIGTIFVHIQCLVVNNRQRRGIFEISIEINPTCTHVTKLEVILVQNVNYFDPKCK